MPCNRTRLDIRIDLVVLGSCHPRPMAPVKILFVGDARGDVPSLVKKLEAVNKKSGPFAAAFVVGVLDASGQAQGLPLKSDPQLPIYFLGAGGSALACDMQGC